jgi:PAS domain S-box-containing protein
MSADPRQLRSLLRVGLPVALAAVFVCLAVINILLVKTWRPDPEDGVFWERLGTNVVAREVDPDGPGARAGLRQGDTLVTIGGREIRQVGEVLEAQHTASEGDVLEYVVMRSTAELPVSIALAPVPTRDNGLYYSLAMVGILSIVVGASVRLRRPADPATLHFYWLSVAFFGGLAFTMSGRLDRLDYFFYWADAVAWLALPPMFVHFALVFPDRPNPWVRTDTGRAVLPLLYVPAFVLGGTRIWFMLRLEHGASTLAWLERLERLDLIYLSACLAGGLVLMVRALQRLRSVTARRQLRWIVWGSSVGAVPFVVLYVVPFLIGRPLPIAEYTAVLLGCIPLAFASAIVRYRLMDIEVILKKGLVVTAVGLLLVILYSGTMELAGLVLGVDQEGRSFWALLATLVVVLVAPRLWHAIQNGLDRLYYRDRYDYRRALVTFARELNTELDLQRLSSRLVERVQETLAVDKLALLVPDARVGPGRFTEVAAHGFDEGATIVIPLGSALGTRLADGQTVVVDDPVPARRLSGEEGAHWRETGLFSFVPCVSKAGTIGVLAAGRRPHGEPLSSEDMTLLGAVAGQAATALENARLYGELAGKADEIERLRQFGDSVVESLSDGLVVVDLDDRVLRWNRRMEVVTGIDRGRAVGRPLGQLLDKPFLDTLSAVRASAPAGTAIYRAPLVTGPEAGRRSLLVNASITPLQREGAQAGWIIVIEDVTDRANLEEQLRLSEKMAAIGLLAAGVAHEVNTPLTGISSFTQMLLERADPGNPDTQLLEKIERQTFRAAKIISSLLNLARPSTADAGPVDVNVVIGDVLSLLEHQLRASRIQVRKDLAPGPAVVRGVEYKLQQVFLNLFLNARDAMPRGGWLTIATRPVDGHVDVEVSDTGVGIPSDQLARIYDPFFTTKPEGRGTGLGLSVTYGIVQEHGGTLTCESDVGEGTRFRLTLPILKQPSAGAAAQ